MCRQSVESITNRPVVNEALATIPTLAGDDTAIIGTAFNDDT